MQRPSAAVLLLAGLIAADVVLVTGAVRSTHVDTTALARAMESSAAAAGATGSTAPDGTTSAAAAAPPSGKVSLAALTSTRAWRAASGSVRCSPGAKPADIGHTGDGGRHWTRVEVPLTTVAGPSYADGRIIATGTDAGCRPASYALSSTSTPRTTTKAPAWAIDAADPTRLLSAGSRVAQQPCAGGLLDVAANSSTDVVVLCGDHSVRHSTDGGATWDRRTRRSGVIAIAAAATRSTRRRAPLAASRSLRCPTRARPIALRTRGTGPVRSTSRSSTAPCGWPPRTRPSRRRWRISADRRPAGTHH